MIKKFLLALMIFVLNVTTCAANANSEEFDAAELRFICALCSFGAYDNNNSAFARSMLTADKWDIEAISQKTKRVESKAYLITRDDDIILTIAGTENLKDVEIDFRLGRVPLNENTALSPYEEKTGDKIFVHRGFRDYADVLLENGFAERLTTLLKNNPNKTLYITGHSLGGAVATLVAVRLTDLGVNKNQLQVITFGAPAVGSKAFAAAYKDKINLTRVSVKGDFIKKSLGELGYVQFGELYTYKSSASSKQFEHKISVYLDCAIREYYAAGGNLKYENQVGSDANIYIAPVVILKNSLHKTDEEIVLRSLNDIIGNHFNRAVFAPELKIDLPEEIFDTRQITELVNEAKSRGCKYALIRIIGAKKIRNSLDDSKHVTLEEHILDANGSMLFMQTAGSSTKDLTILEVMLIAQENLLDNIKEAFKGK